MIDRRRFVAGTGAVLLAVPHAAEGAAGRETPEIGVLWHAGNAEEEEGPYLRALLEGFKGLGYVEGRNIAFEHRFPNESPEQFRRMAAELVSLRVDVLVSVGSVAPTYAKDATTTIPVVFMLEPTLLVSTWWTACRGRVEM